jgi:hypothetical protein
MVVVEDGSNRKEFEAVCLIPLFPVVVADTMYSNFALPCVDTKEAGRLGPGT